MSRKTTVTFAASAVTLACLAASLYASPVVVAENMGRQVQTFSPLDPTTYPTAQDTPQLETAAAAPREYSILPEDTAATAPASTELRVEPRRVEQVPLTPAGSASPVPEQPRPVTTAEPTALPSVEVELPVQEETAEPTEEPSDAGLEPPADIDSEDSLTVIVNKLRPLPADYEPADLVELPVELGDGTYELRETAAQATEELFAAAADADIDLTVISAYRSYAYQQQLYDNYLSQYGSAATNQISARPGHSEHQTGLAIDVDTPDGQHTLQQNFGQTEAGQWLAEHAHQYGFVIRYPQDQHEVTGFSYEPWHLRYFGEQFATQIMEESGVAELAFELAPAPDYEE